MGGPAPSPEKDEEGLPLRDVNGQCGVVVKGIADSESHGVQTPPHDHRRLWMKLSCE